MSDGILMGKYCCVTHRKNPDASCKERMQKVEHYCQKRKKSAYSDLNSAYFDLNSAYIYLRSNFIQ